MFNNNNMILGVMVLLSILWSATCVTRTYVGYTYTHQQCLQISFVGNLTELSLEVELAVHCSGRLVGSPGLEYDRKYLHHQFVIASESQKDLVGYVANVYQDCGLIRAPYGDLSPLFTGDNYETLFVDFDGDVVILKKGKC
ncbi:hypothetical protein FOL47_009922 [Perkinsus chesapeaki]|uniref:Uncharacterized protein n=1 Tax=Perkinsus chesapeaki TaxID=330153 RepID=A0A7J6L5S5_PERCH|nr:hypothetical protein FOL47_009922 [Perkinsus chesapeaki]